MFFAPNPGVMAAGNQGPPAGQVLFTSSGTFIVPADVTSICAVVIGFGAAGTDLPQYDYSGSGAGGGLAASNAIPVIPGEALTVTVAQWAVCKLARGGTDIVAAQSVQDPENPVQPGMGLTGDVKRTGGAGRGGYPGTAYLGGGAAGYSSDGQAGSAGGFLVRGGQGTNPYALGAGGAGGGAPDYEGGDYGGGGGNDGFGGKGAAGKGCVYIIYGEGRSFPSNNTGPV